MSSRRPKRRWRVHRRARRGTSWWRVLLALGLLAGVAFLPPVLLKQAYPLRYWAEVEGFSRESGLDPLLVASVIRVESGFEPSARSSKGAVGLMQVMPDTGRWVAGQLGVPDAATLDLARLSDPGLNIRLGTWYLGYLVREFGGNIVAALAAYNAGKSNVEEWMSAQDWSPRPDQVGDIPFPETRDFVRKVLATRSWYGRLYGRRAALDAWRAWVRGAVWRLVCYN